MLPVPPTTPPTGQAVSEKYSPDVAQNLARSLYDDVRRHYARSEDVPYRTAERLRRLAVLADEFRAEAEAALVDLIGMGVIDLTVRAGMDTPLPAQAPMQ